MSGERVGWINEWVTGHAPREGTIPPRWSLAFGKPAWAPHAKALLTPSTITRCKMGQTVNDFVSGTETLKYFLCQIFTRDEDDETKPQNSNLFSLLFLILGIISFITFFLQVSVYIFTFSFSIWRNVSLPNWRDLLSICVICCLVELLF